MWEDTHPEMSRQTELPEPAGKRAFWYGAVGAARIAWSLWAATLALVVGAHVLGAVAVWIAVLRVSLVTREPVADVAPESLAAAIPRRPALTAT